MDQENTKKWRKIVAKAWADENYKKCLVEDPKAVLQEEGLELPEELNYRVIEDDATTRTLVLNWPPQDDDGSESLEERLAAFGYIGF